MIESQKRECAVCGQEFAPRDVVPGTAVRTVIADFIRRDHPEWSSSARICRTDLTKYCGEYLESLLQLEKGDLTELGKEALASLQRHGLLAADVATAFEKELTIGQRIGDYLSKIGSARMMFVWFAAFIVGSIVLNSALLYWRVANPYPFVLLNLVLVCLVALQAPIIGMSLSRHQAKDRLRWEHSYLVSLRAGLDLKQLHEKLDNVLTHQRQRLVEIEQTQLLLLSQIEKRPHTGLKSA